MISKNDLVTVTEMGHIVEVQHMNKVNTKINIKKIDKYHYVNLSNGEVLEFDLSVVRSDNINSLRQTFKKMRYLINNNFVGNRNELFVTLTYRGDLQTSDFKSVAKDFDRFIKRFKRRYDDLDYIRVLEPHATGNWHIHVLMRFNAVSEIFISNEEMSKLWGNGFVNVKAIENIDNVGAYLSAYLADVSTDELRDTGLYPEVNEGIFEKEVNGQSKKYIKGGRLSFYPSGMNLYTSSRGIEQPKRETMFYDDIKKIVGHGTPHYKKSISISDDLSNYKNTITYEQYNLKRL